jgi:hypothetical protein
MPDPFNSAGSAQDWASQFGGSPLSSDSVGIIPVPQQSYASSYQPQPTFWQMEASSPLGRLAFGTIKGAEDDAAKMLGLFGLPGQSAAQSAADATTNWYNNALAATANRPGYADWRSYYDQHAGQPNFLDHLVPNIESPLAGAAIGALTFNPDRANAAMDAMTAKVQADTQAHPVSSPAANLAGDFLIPDPLDLAGDAALARIVPSRAKSFEASPAISKLVSGVGNGLADLGKDADWLNKAVDTTALVDAVQQALEGGGTSQPSPDPTELPRLPGSPPPISSGPPAWVPMLPPSDATTSSVNLNTPDYLKPGWSYDGPQADSPVNLVPGMTVTGDYGGSGDDEDQD